MFSNNKGTTNFFNIFPVHFFETTGRLWEKVILMYYIKVMAELLTQFVLRWNMIISWKSLHTFSRNYHNVILHSDNNELGRYP